MIANALYFHIMWKQFIREYLTFTKKERTGIFILLGLIICCLLAPFLYPLFILQKKYDHSKFEKEITQFKMLQVDSASNKYTNNYDRDEYNDYHQPPEKTYRPPPGELFYFDPNSATINDWKRLGIREKTAETIQKYISKGGKFFKPGDISKIWGLRAEDVNRLLPYVRIENVKTDYVKNETGSLYKNNRKNYKEKSVSESIEINSSDTTAFILLPGIGNKLAQRIIAFRDKLGGFYSVDQIKETYGLPDSVFQKIKPQLTINASGVKKININSASVDEMRSHPYVRYNLANVLAAYRKQHGNFNSVADIKKIMIVTDEIYNKVAPYLSAEQ